jgi:ribosomal protein L40E
MSTRSDDRGRPGNGGFGLAEGRMTAVAACLICGTEPSENARFCRGCGSPVSDAGTRAAFGR